MTTPLANWDNDDSTHPMLIWWTRLDGRWQVEVQRVNDYNGTLFLFDHANENKLQHSEPVGLAFGAIFGPDMSDVARWEQTSIDVVDALPPA